MTKKETKSQPKPHKSHKKVFDITPPGKAPAAPNSRSVIASAKPPVSDDQFVPGAPKLHSRAADPSEKRPLMNGKQHKAVAPLSTLSNPAADQEHEDASATVTSTPSVATPDNSPTPEVSSVPEVPTAPEVDSPELAPSLTDDESAASVAPAKPANDSEQQLAATNSGHLATEQVVEAESSQNAPESGATTDSSESITPDPARSTTAPHITSDGTPVFGQEVPIQAEQHSGKSIDELLAESGAPVLEHERSAPGLIISHHAPHRTHWGVILLAFLGVLILAAIALNFLLDAEIIQTTLDIPHTDFL